MTGGFLQEQWYAAALSRNISTDETFAYLTKCPIELKWEDNRCDSEIR